ncbi:MAG: hypothetical protein Q9178_007891 [Gyalolechia marmorata]
MDWKTNTETLEQISLKRKKEYEMQIKKLKHELQKSNENNIRLPKRIKELQEAVQSQSQIRSRSSTGSVESGHVGAKPSSLQAILDLSGKLRLGLCFRPIQRSLGGKPNRPPDQTNSHIFDWAYPNGEFARMAKCKESSYVSEQGS